MEDQTVAQPAPEGERLGPVDCPLFPKLEALLFYYGEAIAISKIGSLLELKEKECRTLVDSFGVSLASDPRRGLFLMHDRDTVQLVTKPELKSIAQKLIQEEFREELSPAGTETLSIIAYLGPITRPRIDYIRGVNSSFTVRNLLMRGLIDREHGEERGHLFEYRVSVQFLRHMGLGDVRELPEYQKYHALLEDFEAQRAESSKLEEQAPAVKTKSASQQTPS